MPGPCSGHAGDGSAILRAPCCPVLVRRAGLALLIVPAVS